MSFSPPTDPREPVTHIGDPDAPRVLFIHGFTGSPQTLQPQYLAAIEAGLNVKAPLLSGHGTSIEDMVATRYSDYLSDVRRAMDDFCLPEGQVAVVAISMGGTLALDLASSDPRVSKLVLVNPLIVAPADSFLDFMDQVVATGIEIAPAIGSDIADTSIKEVSYNGAPIRAAKSLYLAARKVEEQAGLLSLPILLFSSQEDHVIPPISGEVLFERAKNVTRVILSRSYHVATLDFDKEIINLGMLEFLK